MIQLSKKNSSEYWEQRIASQTWKTYNSLEEKNIALLEFYQDAGKNIKEELYTIAEKYSKDGVLSLSDMHKQNRLTKLNKSMEGIVKGLGEQTEALANENMREGFESTYANVRESLGDIEFAMPNKKLMEDMLERPWLGSNFSSRMWKNQTRLVAALNDQLLTGLQQGKTVAEMAIGLNNIMGTGFNNAHRLVRTETMHYLNNAALQGYKDAGCNKVQIWAATDERTCGTCGIGGYHEKVYPLDKAPILPLHANCRCTYLPVVEDEKAYRSASRGDGAFNGEASFAVDIPGVGSDVLDIISKKSRKIAELGDKDGNEHLSVIDRISGDELYYEKGSPGEVGCRAFFDLLDGCKPNSIITIHNHSKNDVFSLIDLNTDLQSDSVYAGIAVGHNGRMVCVADQCKKLEFKNVFTEMEEKYRSSIIEPLLLELNSGNMTVAEFSRVKEEKLSEQLAKDYFRVYRR